MTDKKGGGGTVIVLFMCVFMKGFFRSYDLLDLTTTILEW